MSNLDDFETAAAGMDEDGEGRPESIAEAFVSGGPEGLFDEIERMVPVKWREHIADFPLTAIALAFGVGVFLGAKKGDELVAAGSAMVSAAAASSLGEVLGKFE